MTQSWQEGWSCLAGCTHRGAVESLHDLCSLFNGHGAVQPDIQIPATHSTYYSHTAAIFRASYPREKSVTISLVTTEWANIRDASRGPKIFCSDTSRQSTSYSSSNSGAPELKGRSQAPADRKCRNSQFFYSIGNKYSLAGLNH